MKDTHHIIAENTRRKQAQLTAYDPVTGQGCSGQRTHVGDEWLPASLLAEWPDYAALPSEKRRRARVRHDFEYWAATCVTIKDKLTGQNIGLRLNAPQRRLLAVMETQRLAGKPIRVILLKHNRKKGVALKAAPFS